MPKGIYKRTKRHKQKISGKGNGFYGKHHTEETRAKMRQKKVGKKRKSFTKETINRMSRNSYLYIDGRCLKTYYCIDCDKGINFHSALYGQGRCGSCARRGRKRPDLSEINKARKGIFKHSEKTKQKIQEANKKRWKSEEYRINTIKAQREGMKLTPNKPEKLLNALLNKLYPKEYKFVGNGEIVFCGFNPDFINCNGQKKIIELYGDYWHNRPEVKERDNRRLIAYNRYGYKTLIIWEKELKSLEKLKEKIVLFDKENKNVIKC